MEDMVMDLESDFVEENGVLKARRKRELVREEAWSRVCEERELEKKEKREQEKIIENRFGKISKKEQKKEKESSRSLCVHV